MNVKLAGRQIPRNAAGDPAFCCLDPATHQFQHAEYEVQPKPTILESFTPEEVVHMVNRYIYFTEYQRKAHADRGKLHRAALHEVRKTCKRMFGVAWDFATVEQQQAALKATAQKGGEAPTPPQT